MKFQRYLHIAAFLFITVPLVWIIGCPSGSDSGSGSLNPPLNEIGIWTGTITTTSGAINPPEVYDLAMILYTPAGASEGRAMGAAFKRAPAVSSDHFLFDGGYEDVRNLNLGYDLLVGTSGDHGSFLKEYDYQYGSQGDSAQRGKMELSVDGSSMTGSVVFAEYGGFSLQASYSAVNAIDTNLASLANFGEDATIEHRWSNDNTGDQMIISGLDAGNLTVTQPPGACNGSGTITDVTGYNLFILENVSIVDCNYQAPDTVPPIIIPDVDHGPYDGLGVLVDNAGNPELLIIMTDQGVALYNQFVEN